MKIRPALRLCLLFALFVALSAVPVGAAQRYILPQLVAGGDYVAHLDIVNLNEKAESGTVHFYKTDGSAMLVSYNALIGSDIPFSLDRGESVSARIFITTGLSVGYAIVESSAANSKLAVTLRYRYLTAGERQMFSVPACVPGRRFTVPVVSDGAVQSALGFINTNNVFINATVQLVNNDGAVVGSTGIGLAAGLQKAMYLHELFPSLTKFHGSAVIGFQDASSFNINGAALALVDDDRVLASTPVTPSEAPIDVMLHRCPTAAEVASINADLTFTWDYDPTAGSNVCTAAQGSADLTETQRRVYQVLLVMKTLRFSEPLPWTDKQLYPWFKGAISGLRFIPSGNFCCSPANVINIGVPSNSYLQITSDWIDPYWGGGLLDTLVVFVHEARHNEGKPHTCGSNDNTIAEMGSWGVQYYLDRWLGEKVDKTFVSDPRYLMYAVGHAQRIKETRFCTPQ